MFKALKSLLLFLVLFVLSSSGFTQSIEFGLNAGLVANRYSLSTNHLGNSTWIRQGSLDYSTRFGGQAALKSKPNMYKTFNTVLKHGLMLEISGCRCGGNTEMVTKEETGGYKIYKLNYRTWQADFALLYEMKIENFEVLLGPAFTVHTYRGVSNNRVDPDTYEYTLDQIKKSYFGFDFGIGYRFDNLLVSSRYHTNLSAFGESTNRIPSEYGNHQFRLIFSYFMFEKRFQKLFRGLY